MLTHLAVRGVVKYAGTRCSHGWSAEIHPLRGCCFLFTVFGYLAFKSTRYIGFLIFRNQPKPGRAWRGEIRGQRRPREWFAEIQSLAFASAASFCCFCFWLLGLFKSTRYGSLTNFLIFWNPITTRGRGVFYISCPSASTKTRSNQVRVLPLLIAAPPS